MAVLGESQWAAVARAIGNGRTDSACRKQWERLYRVEQQQQQHKRLRGDAEQLEDRASPEAAPPGNGAAASALPAALPALPPTDGAAGRGA